MSLAIAHILIVRAQERAERTVHVAEARAGWDEVVGADRLGGVADPGAELDSGIVQTEKGYQVVLVDTIAGNADAANQDAVAIDRHAAGKYLNAVWDTVGAGRQLVRQVGASDVDIGRRRAQDEQYMLDDIGEHQ